MYLTILLLALMLTGLVLVATGIVVLLKSNNKLAGWIVLAVGATFSLFSGGVFLLVTISTTVRGGM